MYNNESNVTNSSNLILNYWYHFIENSTKQHATEWGMWMRLVGLPIVIVVGLVGNTSTFMAMNTKTLRLHSYSRFLATLAIFDASSLIIRSLFWTNLMASVVGHPPIITFQTTFLCKLNEYLFTSVHIVCSWLVVLVTLERQYVIYNPLKAKEKCTPKSAKMAITGLVIAAFSIEIYAAVWTEYRPGFGCGMNAKYLIPHYVIATSLVSLGPLTIIFICNLHIVYLLNRSSNNTKLFKTDRYIKRVTYMLLGVSLAFLILVLPNALLVLVSTIRKDWAPHLGILMDPANLLWDINYSVNFFIYVISGKQVRAEMVRMCCGCSTNRDYFKRNDLEHAGIVIGSMIIC